MATYTEVIGKELYVYMNGRLLYKKWLNTRQSLVFDVRAYDRNTLVSITDKGTTKNVG